MFISPQGGGWAGGGGGGGFIHYQFGCVNFQAKGNLLTYCVWEYCVQLTEFVFTTDRQVHATDRVVYPTDGEVGTTDRVVRTTDRVNVYN